MLDYMIRHHRTTAIDTCYIGDSDTDWAAAEAAGVTFHWAWEFFGWEEDFCTVLDSVTEARAARGQGQQR
jgi:phosphoglycolate phosphatase-like HAD superfamily hydrolase